jgi:hypothetical protein
MLKRWGDDLVDLDHARRDELECERVGVGVAEGPCQGDLSSLDERHVDADGVGAHSDKHDAARRANPFQLLVASLPCRGSGFL